MPNTHYFKPDRLWKTTICGVSPRPSSSENWGAVTCPVCRNMGAILQAVAEENLPQHFYEEVRLTALMGMNIGCGPTLQASGEKNLLGKISRYYPEEMSLMIFDVGANVGNYTVELIDSFSRHRLKKIVSFEPSRATFEALRQRVGSMPGVHLEPFGFGAREETRTLYSPSSRNNSVIASLYPRRLDHFNITMDRREEVTIRTLDAYCQEQKIEHIHFLKLDVEGHEFEVLQGAREMIEENRIDFIQFEFGGTYMDSRVFFQDFFYLLRDHFSIYRILKTGCAHIPVYREFDEVFLITNFIAERKQLTVLSKG